MHHLCYVYVLVYPDMTLRKPMFHLILCYSVRGRKNLNRRLDGGWGGARLAE